MFLCFMLKDNLKSISVIFFQREEACELTASTNCGMPDGNEDMLRNDGTAAVVNCCCKHQFLSQLNSWLTFFVLAGWGFRAVFVGWTLQALD